MTSTEKVPTRRALRPLPRGAVFDTPGLLLRGRRRIPVTRRGARRGLFVGGPRGRPSEEAGGVAILALRV